jgi:hypothetical protein
MHKAQISLPRFVDRTSPHLFMPSKRRIQEFRMFPKRPQLRLRPKVEFAQGINVNFTFSLFDELLNSFDFLQLLLKHQAFGLTAPKQKPPEGIIYRGKM